MASPEPRLTGTATQLVRHALRLSPTLGATRLVCVDGPAGSGKTTLGHALVEALTRACPECRGDLVHMDDIYEGWDGLAATPARVESELLRPLAQGRPGGYRRYDWYAERLAEWRPVTPGDLLVLEGVGSGSGRYADLVTLLVWVEAPREVRIARGVARDGEQVLPRWRAWMADEETLFARENTRERADVRVDTTTESSPPEFVRAP